MIAPSGEEAKMESQGTQRARVRAGGGSTIPGPSGPPERVHLVVSPAGLVQELEGIKRTLQVLAWLLLAYVGVVIHVAFF